VRIAVWAAVLEYASHHEDRGSIDGMDHETIAADIFDHVLATIPSFDLEIFEGPTGKDFQAAISAK
jgi:hypothetical protein